MGAQNARTTLLRSAGWMINGRRRTTLEIILRSIIAGEGKGTTWISLYRGAAGRRETINSGFDPRGQQMITKPPELFQVTPYTSRLCSTAAAMKLLNRGCGSKGRDLSSGWNCTPMNQGWSGS